MKEDVGKIVFELVEDYSGRSLLTFRRCKPQLDTDLSKYFWIDPLNACELLEKYTELFNVNLRHYQI